MAKRDEKREMVLKEAMRLFSHKGYFGTGINEILSACQIPKGSFYYYFPDGKEQLAAEVLHYAYETMEVGIFTGIFSISDSDALAVFTGMLDRLISLFDREHIYQSLVITFMGLESVYISERVSRAAREVYEKWQDLYRQKLLSCGYTPENAERYSLTLFTLVHGALISCWLKQDTVDMQRMKAELPHILREK